MLFAPRAAACWSFWSKATHIGLREIPCGFTLRQRSMAHSGCDAMCRRRWRRARWRRTCTGRCRAVAYIPIDLRAVCVPSVDGAGDAHAGCGCARGAAGPGRAAGAHQHRPRLCEYCALDLFDLPLKGIYAAVAIRTRASSWSASTPTWIM